MVAILGPRLRLVARRWAPPHEVEDLAQEALVIVLEARRAGRLREPAELAPFAVGVVRNLARSGRRREARRAELVSRLAPTPAPAPPPDAIDSRRLAEHLRRLPWREMDVLVRSYAQGEPAEAIAADLGTTPGNVRVLRHRALARLRELFLAGALPEEELSRREAGP